MHVELAQIKLDYVRFEKVGNDVDHIRTDCRFPDYLQLSESECESGTLSLESQNSQSQIVHERL
jgi:hypothetical protein